MLNTIQEAIEEIKAGKTIIVVDDEDRENEGDFLTAARNATPETINFMVRHGRGLVCAPITAQRARELDLMPMICLVMVVLPGSLQATGQKPPLRLLIRLPSPKTWVARGIFFPLIAKDGGVLRRTGHTEAAVDLAVLAGFEPAGVICEIMKEDGEMARLPDLLEIAKEFNLKIVSIKDLIAYRLEHESMVRREVAVKMPTEWGDFDMIAYTQVDTGENHLALVKGTWEPGEPILVRVHSSCMTGDIFGSCRCDCGPQLHKAMEMISKEGKGAIVYMNQEGRGIGLINKLRAYHLQENGYDTVDANLKLGFKMDQRDYGIGAQILRSLGITKMRLMSNNPKKRAGLIGYGLEVVENVPIEIASNPHNEAYLRTKRDRMDHAIMRDH
ncbi:uncharacterized protein [Henckelia pumila]|uniref:uncharacterized protein n=1 Tax=Henckelia pumila TaxID=405737 RepID=UPI003C6E4880